MYQQPKRRRLSKLERQEVYDKCGGHCAYCGIEISISEMQVDHLIPMEFYDVYAAEGRNIDVMDNFMPACRSCNKYKSSLTLEKFRTAVERWPDVLMRDSVTYRNAVRFGVVKPNPHPIMFYFEQINQKKVKMATNTPPNGTPLAKAIQDKQQHIVSCLDCQKHIVIGGASYCEVSGKLLHPMLLNGDKHKCPHAGSEEPTNQNRAFGAAEVTDEKV